MTILFLLLLLQTHLILTLTLLTLPHLLPLFMIQSRILHPYLQPPFLLFHITFYH